MVSPDAVSPQFLLWSESLMCWAIATYGLATDSLRGESIRMGWRFGLGFRAALAACAIFGISRSMVFTCGVFLAILLQPLMRRRLSQKSIAEFEICWILLTAIISYRLILDLHLSPRWSPDSTIGPRLAALCVSISIFLLVVQGGTYIVRGILSKSGTLPIQLKEYNRGRLIGNLERIILTIVVAAGSYAALAFLVAAKGLVRSKEFEGNRNFAEYFLIGSLASVLVALCAGLALRFALLQLWPELLALRMQ